MTTTQNIETVWCFVYPSTHWVSVSPQWSAAVMSSLCRRVNVFTKLLLFHASVKYRGVTYVWMTFTIDFCNVMTQTIHVLCVIVSCLLCRVLSNLNILFFKCPVHKLFQVITHFVGKVCKCLDKYKVGCCNMLWFSINRWIMSLRELWINITHLSNNNK